MPGEKTSSEGKESESRANFANPAELDQSLEKSSKLADDRG